MALMFCKAICETIAPFRQIKRFKSKINIQKPKPPHFEKAKYLALAKPWFLSQKKNKTSQELCGNVQKLAIKKDEPNPFQNIIAKELYGLFAESKLIAFCHYNPMTSNQKFKANIAFKKEQMHAKQYGKKTLDLALSGTAYEKVLDFYVSHNMIILSPEPNIKKLLKILKKFPQLILLAGIYENRLINRDELTYYSSIPNIQAAQSGLVQTLQQAGSQLVSNLNQHQISLVSNLEERIKQLKEKPGQD
ncbi:large ribosomal subunit protein uL10m [Cylas formicarius]|uniref:large ribosomal subunit protein uL10m n=1 Tax=Cylas formicarius TaxID=197179 RepID=UPI0029586953|nr:large ribosomal subunit protein uL10m [Cylas formicarius]